MSLGNFAMSLYVLIQFFSLKSGQSQDVLFRRKTA